MSDPKDALPPGWEAQLARDLAELLAAAAELADGGEMRETPDGFADALRAAGTRVLAP